MPGIAKVRVARPSGAFSDVVAFYRDEVRLPVLSTFEGHDGYDGVIFGLPDATRQLELVHSVDARPRPGPEDQLVLYPDSEAAMAAIVARLTAAGHRPQTSPNPYWARVGAVCFVDPDGYWLVLSPES